MISPQAFAAGMARLAVTFNREMTDEAVSVFADILRPKMTEAQWATAVKRATEVETFFPPPAVLLRYGLAEQAVNAKARAVEIYNAIVDGYQSGRGPHQRQVADAYGKAARDAFMAAGAAPAFEWCELASEPFRRKAFVEAYSETVSADPRLALPETTSEPCRLKV